MFVPKESGKPYDWNDFTLIVPTVSVGNVGQMTSDLLISTLGLSVVGYLSTDCVVPVVGSNPYAQCGSQNMFQLTTSLEVFESAEHKLVIVQQRSPFVKGKRLKFADELAQWINSCHFKQVFILTSVFAHERRDTQLHGPQTRYVLTSKAESEIGATLKDGCQWIPLEKRSSEPLRNAAESDIFIPGSGIAKSLLQKCSDAGMAAAILLIFCAEGDNITESLQLAAYIESYFKWIPRMQNKSETDRIPWKIPSSWQLQFGSHFYRAMY